METVTLATEKGLRVEVEARVVRGGLAITPTYGADKQWSRYRLTHLASGFGLGRFATLLMAQRALNAVLALGIDWTQPKDAVATPENGRRCFEAIGAYLVRR